MYHAAVLEMLGVAALRSDHLEALEELGDPDETRHGYLRVAIENQAVVAFYVRSTVGRRLRPGPVTRDPGVEIHRFFGPHEFAGVRWTPGGAAEWQLEADSAEALDALRATVELPPPPAPPRRGLLARLRRR